MEAVVRMVSGLGHGDFFRDSVSQISILYIRNSISYLSTK